MLSEEENRDLLARSVRALAPGGRLVIQDFLLRADKTGPRSGALFSLNMLVNTQGGASYSEDEYTQWLHEAGFSDVRRVPMAGPAGVLGGGRGGAGGAAGVSGCWSQADCQSAAGCHPAPPLPLDS